MVSYYSILYMLCAYVCIYMYIYMYKYSLQKRVVRFARPGETLRIIGIRGDRAKQAKPERLTASRTGQIHMYNICINNLKTGSFDKSEF